MSVMNVAARKRDVARIIAEDPATIVVTRKGETPDDAPTTYTFTGRVQPAGMRSVAIERVVFDLRGEHTVGRYSHGLLAPFDTPKLQTGDRVRSTSLLDGNVVQEFHCIYCAQYTYKLEALLDELE
jgi:hypothetical protein